MSLLIKTITLFVKTHRLLRKRYRVLDERHRLLKIPGLGTLNLWLIKHIQVSQALLAGS